MQGEKSNKHASQEVTNRGERQGFVRQVTLLQGGFRRRYERSMTNLRNLYLPLAEGFWVFDNSGEGLELVARGMSLAKVFQNNPQKWAHLIGGNAP